MEVFARFVHPPRDADARIQFATAARPRPREPGPDMRPSSKPGGGVGGCVSCDHMLIARRRVRRSQRVNRPRFEDKFVETQPHRQRDRHGCLGDGTRGGAGKEQEQNSGIPQEPVRPSPRTRRERPRKKRIPRRDSASRAGLFCRAGRTSRHAGKRHRGKISSAKDSRRSQTKRAAQRASSGDRPATPTAARTLPRDPCRGRDRRRERYRRRAGA